MTLSRRTLLKAGLGVGAAALSACLLPGLTFASAQEGLLTPQEVGERQGNRVRFQLEASPTNVTLAGRNVQLYTCNGSYPAPTLRLRAGDDVQLDFTNSLPEATNLHFHGLRIPATGNADNPFRVVSSGETARYEFTVPADSSGLHWYHPHLHGRVAAQLFRGLAGAIVVDNPNGAGLGDMPEQLVVLKDFEFGSDGRVGEHSRMDWMVGREGDLLTVNGVERPTLTLPGGAVRLRLLNASNARYHRLQLPSATMHVVATDGRTVPAPYEVDELLVAPGERYDVVAEFPNSGRKQLMSVPYSRMSMGMMGGNNGGGMMGGSNGGMGMMGGNCMGAMTPGVTEPTPLLTLEAGAASAVTLPETLTSIQKLTPQDANKKRRITLSMNMMGLEFLIDGKTFDPSRTDFTPQLGTTEHWEIVSETMMDHPMHLHVYPFQVYARGGQPEPRVAWRDIVNVRANSSADILIPFTDFPGKTVFHCHILEHEDQGMMSVVDVTGS